MTVPSRLHSKVYFLTTSAFRVLAVLSDDSIREASTGQTRLTERCLNESRGEQSKLGSIGVVH